MHVETTCLMKWQCGKYTVHGRSSNTGIDRMVIDRGMYSSKNDALDNFRFVMAICTGQYACFVTISFIYIGLM